MLTHELIPGRLLVVAGNATDDLFFDRDTGCRITGIVTDWEPDVMCYSFGLMLSNWTIGFTINLGEKL
jgi:hypothetical protein